jgi:hypothetical protein
MAGVEGARVRKLLPGQAAALWGVLASAWAIFLFPLFFGPIGMILGGVAWYRGEQRGRWVLLAGLGCMVLGLLIGMMPDKFVSN